MKRLVLGLLAGLLLGLSVAPAMSAGPQHKLARLEQRVLELETVSYRVCVLLNSRVLYRYNPHLRPDCTLIAP